MSLNERNISKFLECDFNEVEISLDGLSPAESQEIRVKSDSRKIIRNIKQLIRARDKISSSLKISISTTQFLRARADIEYPEKLIPVTPDWLTDELPDTVNFKPYLAMRWPHMNVDKQYELVYVNGEDRNYCDHPVNTITIRYNGDIVPCCYDLTSQLLMGNIMHKSLLGIFNGDKYRSLRSSIEEKKYKPLCMNCNLVRPQVYLVKPEIPISTN
jgi:radical SAM protein with 4Fe4S-binding SPASM domain